MTRRLAALMLLIGLGSVSGTVSAQAPQPDNPPELGTLPRTIPLFPLQDVMLFPKMTRPLHIFEARYREMVADALMGDRIIGMVLLEPGHEAEYEGRPPIYAVGCLGVIADVTMYPDGRYDIVLSGLTKFRITSEDDSRTYRLGHIEILPELVEDDERQALADRRERLIAAYARIAPNAEPPPPELSDEDLVNALSQFLALDPLDRQRLLEAEGPLARLEALLALIEPQVEAGDRRDLHFRANVIHWAEERAMTAATTHRVKPAIHRAPLERRMFVGDRRDTWRGSRRDADWIRHFEEEARLRRGQPPLPPGRLAVN